MRSTSYCEGNDDRDNIVPTDKKGENPIKTRRNKLEKINKNREGDTLDLENVKGDPDGVEQVDKLMFHKFNYMDGRRVKQMMNEMPVIPDVWSGLGLEEHLLVISECKLNTVVDSNNTCRARKKRGDRR